METQIDYLIVGGGIIGLAIAHELHTRNPAARILVLEKESEVACHGSGRNSGVLHAGFYYSPDSLKARFTRDGNARMKAFARQHGLKLNETGKVVVARSEDEIEALFELERRGKRNGVNVRMLTVDELRDVEPNAKTCRHALFSPDTATIDPVEVCRTLQRELSACGVTFIFGDSYARRLDGNTIETTSGRKLAANRFVNAAGLHADKIAKDFGFAEPYTIIPFKGIYLKYTRPDKPIRTHIYPVPNLRNPFLGVHYTITVDGVIKLGPTAIPAFWRENYRGLAGFDARELAEILGWEAKLFASNAFGFRRLAIAEMQKYSRTRLARQAADLVHHVDRSGFSEWSRPGIRAQLLNTRTKELVMDFVVEGDRSSTHVLNAVSPAFTSSFPFAAWLVETFLLQP